MKIINKIEIYIFCILTIIIFIIYYPILSHDFIYNMDDKWMIMNQFTEGGWNFINLTHLFSSSYHSQYAPVNELLYMSIYSIFGYNPTAFHGACLLLHLINTLLIYIILKKILLFRNHIEKSKIIIISFLTTLLFTIHPLNVESVSWISASKILTYSFFYLLATYTYLIYTKKQTIFYYLLTLLFFCCSLGGKEQAVTFPIWLLLVSWFTKTPLKQNKIWFSILSFFFISMAYGITYLIIQSTTINDALISDTTYPFYHRIVLCCYSLIEYLFKSLFPYKLSFLYPFPAGAGAALPNWILIYPMFVTIIITTLWLEFKKWPIKFGLLFYLIHIAISLHIIPLLRISIVADRYMYLSIIGLAFIFSFYYIQFYYKNNQKKIIILSLGIIYIVFLGYSTHKQCKIWKNLDTMKNHINRSFDKNHKDLSIINIKYINHEEFKISNHRVKYVINGFYC